MRLTYETGGNSYAVGHCCAIALIDQLGYDSSTNATTITNMEQQLPKFLEDARLNGKSIAFASVNDHQLKAEAMLIKAGFVTSQEDWAYRDPTKRSNHPGVKVYTKLLYTPPKV